jgi:hypothetical protein
MLKESFDMFFTEDGEILFDENRMDIERAYETELEVLNQTILKRLQSSDEDWQIGSAISTNLNYLMGSPRTPEVQTEAEDMVFNALTSDGLVDPDLIRVQVEGFDSNILMVSVSVFNRPGLGNNVLNVYNLGFSYDLRDNRCIPRFIDGMGVNNG